MAGTNGTPRDESLDLLRSIDDRLRAREERLASVCNRLFELTASMNRKVISDERMTNSFDRFRQVVFELAEKIETWIAQIMFHMSSTNEKLAVLDRGVEDVKDNTGVHALQQKEPHWFVAALRAFVAMNWKDKVFVLLVLALLVSAGFIYELIKTGVKL